MALKDILGKRGEELAAGYLAEHGYRILERNWRCRDGEIDVIAQLADQIVFVEVKTRSSVAYGHPLEAITPAKLARLRRLAAAWCAQADAHPARIRLDAIAILDADGAGPSIEHLAGIE
jgi:putative endonuclease